MSLKVIVESGLQTESVYCYKISYYGAWIPSISLENGKKWGGFVGMPATKAWLPVPGPDSVFNTMTGVWTDKSFFGIQTVKREIHYVGKDTLTQSSTQSILYNEIDYFPLLKRSQKKEKPCHHVKVEGTIRIPPLVSSVSGKHVIHVSSGSSYSGYLSGYKVQCSVQGTFIDEILVDGIIQLDLGYPGSNYWLKHIEYYVTLGQGLTRYVENGNKIKHFGATIGFICRRGADYVSPITTSGQSLPISNESWYPLSGIRKGRIDGNMISTIETIYQNLSNQLRDPSFDISLQTYSEAAYSNLDLRSGIQVNNLENLFSIDWKSIAKLPKKLKQLGYQIRTLREFIHASSSLYLGKKYGYDNSVRDLNSIAEYIQGNGLSVMKYGKTCAYGKEVYAVDEGTLETHTKLVLVPRPGVNDDVFERITNTLGIEMTPSQLWDCVPFSFAVDWLCKVGDLLEQLDAQALVRNTYKLEYAIFSYKRVWNVPQDLIDKLCIPKGATISDLTVTIYDRCISTTLPPVPLTLHNNSVDSLKQHFVEGGMLVLNYLSN